MLPDDPLATDPAVPVILVPEVRDFVRINAELVALLNLGHSRIRLEGAEGQRLLASGLVGDWRAVVEVHGRTGPEVAANVAAPGLKIILHGSTLDGAGRGLRAGTILLLGNAGDGLATAQEGGMLLASGDAGHRVGLNQLGGTLAVLGAVGRLAGDRQAGGFLFLGRGGFGPHQGRGQRGGQRIGWLDPLAPPDRAIWDRLITEVAPWIDPAVLGRA